MSIVLQAAFFSELHCTLKYHILIYKSLNFIPRGPNNKRLAFDPGIGFEPNRRQTITRTNALRWRHSGHDWVSNHQPHDCLFNRLIRRRSKKTSKLCVTGLCAVNSPGTGEFTAQMASNAENVSIWWRHHGYPRFPKAIYHHQTTVG